LDMAHVHKQLDQQTYLCVLCRPNLTVLGCLVVFFYLYCVDVFLVVGAEW
jgi:hypothetical protein